MVHLRFEEDKNRPQQKVSAEKAPAEISGETEVRDKAVDAVTTPSDVHERRGGKSEDLEEAVVDVMCSDQEYFRPQPTLPEFRRTPSQNGGLTLDGF